MFVDISNGHTFARTLPALSEHATCSGLLPSHPRTYPSGDESAIDGAIVFYCLQTLASITVILRNFGSTGTTDIYKFKLG